MEFFTQLGYLFSNMQWYVAVCIALGLALLVVEIFQPGFGVFGLAGFFFAALSIVLRAVFGKPEDDPLMHVFQMLLIYLIIIGGGFLFFYFAQKKKWLKKSPFMQEETAVDVDFSEGTENFRYLAGKEGKAVTDLRPSGKAEIEGKIFDVVSDFYIAEGNEISVIAVEGIKISVTLKNKEE